MRLGLRWAIVFGCVTGLLPVQAQVLRGAWTDPLLVTDEEAARMNREMNRILNSGPESGPVVRKPRGEAATISVTTLKAPKKAVKAYRKARKLAADGKLEEAEKGLRDAVDIYPEYAVAWHGLGRVLRAKGEPGEARKAFRKAIEVDAKYWKPYAELGEMALAEQKFPEAVEVTDRAIKIAPGVSPAIYLHNAMAKYVLGKLEGAEESVREALRLDEEQEYPKAFHVLGLVLAQRGDRAGAAENLRAYLKHVPDAFDAEVVRRQIGVVERDVGLRPAAAR